MANPNPNPNPNLGDEVAHGRRGQVDALLGRHLVRFRVRVRVDPDTDPSPSPSPSPNQATCLRALLTKLSATGLTCTQVTRPLWASGPSKLSSCLGSELLESAPVHSTSTW